MLISMPTDTSAIFGAFQVIQTSMDFGALRRHVKVEPASL
jgi:hypothetical protein